MQIFIFFIVSAVLSYSVSNAFRIGHTGARRLQQLQMVDITTAMVKELREKSGAGMMDCKKALAENDGNIEGAVDWLRKKGLAAVAKKSSRTASSGLVCVGTTADYKAAAVVEINSETDFVARNEFFQSMVSQVTSIAASTTAEKDILLSSAYVGESPTVQDEITRLVATIGENMNFRRASRLEVKDGIVATYMHNPTKPNMGKIGVAVSLESTSDKTQDLLDLGKKICMHIAANNPEALSIADVKPESLQRERDVLVEQARASGKPEAAIEKMVEGRIRKFYEEVVLLEQGFVMDGKVKVGELVKKAAADLGAPVEITGYIRYTLGEGLAKKED